VPGLLLPASNGISAESGGLDKEAIPGWAAPRSVIYTSQIWKGPRRANVGVQARSALRACVARDGRSSTRQTSVDADITAREHQVFKLNW